MLITKQRCGEGLYGPRYRILIDDKPTRLYVEKSVPPKYRMPQEWDVCADDDPGYPLIVGKGLEAALVMVGAVLKATQKGN